MAKELVVVKSNLPAVLPILPFEASPVLPGLMASLQIARGKSVTAVEKAIADKSLVGLVLARKKLKTLAPPKEGPEGPEVVYDFPDLY
ncbi:MAG: LON peptidase substrate-binding domain-containing protein, partial [Bdellovibrionota bacterium]